MSAIELMLEALKDSIDLVEQEYRHAADLYRKYPTRAKRIAGFKGRLMINATSGSFPVPLTAGQRVDFASAYEAIIRLKPKCAQCDVELQASETGVRTMFDDSGVKQKVCRACSMIGIGELMTRSCELPKPLSETSTSHEIVLTCAGLNAPCHMFSFNTREDRDAVYAKLVEVLSA